MDELSINGDVPPIEGKECEAFLCQDYREDGVIEDRAHITHICFDGIWYRLYFEPFLVFWRRSAEAPKESDEPGFEFGLEDIGKQCDVKGVRFVSLTHAILSDGVEVRFTFDNGQSVTVLHREGRAEVECS